MILFFDTETTGKPRNYNAPVTDLNNWPRVIQLAWALYRHDGKLYDRQCDLIMPDGWEIPKQAFWIKHGYDTDKSLLDGIPIKAALMPFMVALEKCDTIVAHNLSFDNPVLGAEMIRLDMKSECKPKKICTMKSTTDLLMLPGPYGYKYPSLTELHQFLFNCDFDGAHDAMFDVEATAKCFFELKRRNLIV